MDEKEHLPVWIANMFREIEGSTPNATSHRKNDPFEVSMDADDAAMELSKPKPAGSLHSDANEGWDAVNTSQAPALLSPEHAWSPERDQLQI